MNSTIDNLFLAVTLVAFVQVCAADSKNPAGATIEGQKINSTKDKNPLLRQQQAVVALFKIAVYEQDDAAPLDAAVNALAAMPGRIDLTEADPANKGETLGDRLADRVAKNIMKWDAVMLKLARQFHKIELKDHARQRILAQLMAVSMVTRDNVALTEVLKLVPSKVTNPILAFNLACNSALQKDRTTMLKYTKLALELGKSPEQFRLDTDFSPYLNDKEFINLLATSNTSLATSKKATEQATNDPVEVLRAAVLHSIDKGNWEDFSRLMREVEQRGMILIPMWDHEMFIFDLARAAAQKKDRAGMLQYTKHALRYHVPPARFRSDSEFAPYLKDKEFSAILDIAMAAEQAGSTTERDKLLHSLRFNSSHLEQFKQREKEQRERSLSFESPRGIADRVIHGGNVRIFIFVFESIKKQQAQELLENSDLLLFEAVKYGRHDIVRFLLKNAVNIAELNNYDALNNGGLRAEMTTIIRKDDAKMVELLMDGGLDFDMKQNISQKEYSYAKLLGIDTIQLDVSNGFITALKDDAVEVVKLILKRTSGIHFLERRKYVKSLKYHLNYSKLSRRMTVVLLDAGISFDDLYSYHKNESLLTKAIANHETELVEYLLNEKNAPLSKNFQEMHAAVERGDANLLDNLIRNQRKREPGWVFANADFWQSLEIRYDKSDSNRVKLLENLFSGRKLDCIKVFATSAISPNDKLARKVLRAMAVASEKPEAAQYFLE